MTIKLVNTGAATQKLLDAFKDGDEAAQNQAFSEFAQGIANDVSAQFLDAQASNDQSIMAQRGFRVLTSTETEYYDKVIEALKSNSPQQAFAAIPDKMMPMTIIDDVLKNITDEHPLLAAVKPISTGYLTRWVKNKHTKQTAVWGKITDAITQEITSAFDSIDITQNKLSAFACVERGMLDLGPQFLDGYVRTVLGEALACGLEYGIVSGKGVNNEPIGLDRDIHEGVTFSPTTGYPAKTAIPVTSFDVATFGGLVAKLSKDELGHDKPINLVNGGSLAIVSNNNTYLTKVLPATRALGTDGNYRDNFPIATNPIVSNVLADGVALLALLDEYDLFVGMSRGIEYSDEAKFLDDLRCFKIVTYADGKAYDNTASLVLDISNLAPMVVPVEVKGTVTTKASA